MSETYFLPMLRHSGFLRSFALLLLLLEVNLAVSVSIDRGNHSNLTVVMTRRANVSDSTLEKFGSGRYDRKLHPVIWDDQSETSHFLGRICDPASPLEANECGAHLICQNSVCRHCSTNSECPALQFCELNVGGGKCKLLPKMAWEQTFSDPYEFLCTVLIFVSSILAAAAGTGGGGVFVPLLVMLSTVKAESSVPLSQCMVLCSSMTNLYFFLPQRHPEDSRKAKIDYNCVALFEPMIFLGVTLGVIVHRLMPKWILLLLLCFTLGIAMWRTVTKGVSQFCKETAALEAAKGAADIAQAGSRVEEGRRVDNVLSNDDEAGGTIELLWGNRVQGGCCVIVWLVMLTTTLHSFPTCSWSFLTYMLFIALILMMTTVFIERHVVQGSLLSVNESSNATTRVNGTAPISVRGNFVAYLRHARLPLFVGGAGFLGGLLGLGGGIIMGPLLLEIGMHSEAVQATTAAFVFLSSSLACVQFALFTSSHIWHYALWYGGVVMCATAVGQHVCTVLVRKHKRYSVITFAIAGVLLASLVALSIVGSVQVYQDLMSGRQMGFSTKRFCASHNTRTVTVNFRPHPT